MPTPPRVLPSCYVEEAPETPGPVRARVNNLHNQVSELVRKEHAATVGLSSPVSTSMLMMTQRKHRSETSGLENTIAAQKAQLGQTQTSLSAALKELEKCKSQGKGWQAELARCKSEGDGMRDEVSRGDLFALEQYRLIGPVELVLHGAAAESATRARARTDADRRARAKTRTGGSGS